MYRVINYPEAAEQIDAMPVGLLRDYAAVLDAMATAPWDGAPISAANPGAEVRRRLFGPEGMGQVVYLVLERDQEVRVLSVVWLELPDEG